MTAAEIAGILFIGGWLVTAIRFRIMATVCPEPERNLTKEAVEGQRVSVIIPARNEEEKISEALKTWLAIDWPDLEIILVNDRSTDSTGKIIEEISKTDDRLRVITITELPEGWLGKNHALHVGAGHATGQWLLFTDADIHIDPALISDAVQLVSRKNISFAAGLPKFSSANFWNTSFVLTFGTALSLSQQFDRVHLQKSRAFCGIGAFNLIRRDLYEKIGGHSGQKLDIADDMVLGRRAKEAGGNCIILNCHRRLSVSWQEDSLKGAIKGIEKNAFTGFSYSITKMAAGLLLFLFFTTGPLILALISPFWGLGALAALVTAFFQYAPAFQSRSGWWGLIIPISSVLLSWAILRSAFLAHQQGGIYWRGTFYSLDEIKKHNHF